MLEDIAYYCLVREQFGHVTLVKYQIQKFCSIIFLGIFNSFPALGSFPFRT